MFSAAVFKLIRLRSGTNENAYASNYLTPSGYWYVLYDARRISVRPATHRAVVCLKLLCYNVFGDGFLLIYRLHLAAFRS